MVRFNKGIDIDKCPTPMGYLNLIAFVGRSWAVCAVILAKVLE